MAAGRGFQVEGAVWFDARHQVFRQKPLCGAKLNVSCDSPTVFGGECTRQCDRVPFDGEVKVIDTESQREVLFLRYAAGRDQTRDPPAVPAAAVAATRDPDDTSPRSPRDYALAARHGCVQ